MRALVLPLVLIALADQAACASQTVPTTFSATVTDGDDGRFTAAQYFNAYGCTGENRSPHITWTQPPAGTQSLAVTIFDPDAQAGKGWWHWLVSDLPGTARELPAGAGSGSGLPEGAVQYVTDFGTAGYGGPCPPPGETHTYVITVYALKTQRLGLTAATPEADVKTALETQALATATTTLKGAR